MKLQQSEDLFYAHYPIAVLLARRKCRRTSPWLARPEELEAAALEGLWWAARKYDGDTVRAPFSAYCRPWIKGWMSNWLARVLEMKHGTHGHYSVRPATFSELWPDPDGEEIPGGHLPAPTLEVGRQQWLRDLAAYALSLVPQREQTILRRTYWDEWTPTQIACEVGLHKSRVWELRRRALLYLRQQLASELEVTP